MSINATLLGQMITFAIFIWFTMKFVWPPVMKALADRKDSIAEGLAAAERGHKELELAQGRAVDALSEAKSKAAEIVDKANHRANVVLEEAKEEATVQTKRMIDLAKENIAQEVARARRQLSQEVASLAVDGASKILAKELDRDTNAKLIDDVIEKLAS